MRSVTLCFLVRRSGDRMSDVCLGLKKVGFGVGKWAGIGGKVRDGNRETVEQAAKRELLEETIGVG